MEIDMGYMTIVSILNDAWDVSREASGRVY